jgi:hypothetical protein
MEEKNGISFQWFRRREKFGLSFGFDLFFTVLELSSI